ncbi:chemotaxis protein CheA [Haloterrigena salina JCM 13891]|uniref:Chemotaxis protein CheA n=1 Tax=Haloterrigena salina JCM 13891 TaxID=1227488 RepID=M0BUD6_9EURY|nr:chemotaxis protein CheA [Haloterrigena salina]ELZ14550.1 chemotaxis protein CheA [Haloterrigena salina JCM 13891]
MTDYLTDFVQESEERITELNNALLTLERDPTDDEAMENIFRVAHTLKGNCGAMGLEPASDLAHAIEDLLDAVRQGGLEVTPELMDVVFDAVDELETMIDEVATGGEIETDPSATIAALRDQLEAADGHAAIATPSTDEIDAVTERFDPPADDEHRAYLVRLAIAERDGVNSGKLVVDALIDAFDLIGTQPPRDEIEAGEYDGTFDAVFGSAVGKSAITSGLEPVEEVDDFELVDISDRFDARSDGSDAATEPGDGISTEDAADLEVDDLLDEFDEFDNLDEMVDDVDDDELEAFEEMGEAGSFDDLLDDDDLEVDGELGEPAVDPIEDDATADDDASEQAADDASADADDVDDANAVFNELKDEVEMVGFDELQDELEELEFDEFDSDDEVDMDELLGEDADADDAFLAGPEPTDDAVDDILVDAGDDEPAAADAVTDDELDELLAGDEDESAPDDAVADEEVDDLLAGGDEPVGAATDDELEDLFAGDEEASADAATDDTADAATDDTADAATDDTAAATTDEPADAATDDEFGDLFAGDEETATASTDEEDTAVEPFEPEAEPESAEAMAEDATAESGSDAAVESEPALEDDEDIVDEPSTDDDVEAVAETDPDAEPESATESESAADSEPAVEAEPAAEAESATESASPAVETETRTDADDGLESATAAESDLDGEDGDAALPDEDEPAVDDPSTAESDDAIEAALEPGDDGDALEDESDAESTDLETPETTAETDGTDDGSVEANSEPEEATDDRDETFGDDAVTADSAGDGQTADDAEGELDDLETGFEDGFDSTASADASSDDPFAADDGENDPFAVDDEDPFADDAADDAFGEDDAFAADDPFADESFDTEFESPDDEFDDVTPATDADAESVNEVDEVVDGFDDFGDEDDEAATDSSAETPSFDDDAGADDSDESAAEVVHRIEEPTFENPGLTVPESTDRPDADEQTDEIQSVRVDIDQIDSLLTLVEGLVTSRVRLRHTATESEATDALETELDDLEDLTTDLQETVMDIRLVPLQTVASRLPRVVRDIARDQDKEVAFEMTGEDVELDRSILDRIGDPLIHLVRNAVDHGIEPPAEREAADKPREGSVEVHADRSRDQVRITVEDDGSGLDPDRLRDEAVEAGVRSEDEVANMSDDEAYDLIFHPGLSTADEVTDVSGRGVGMDVVKRTIEDLDGTVAIDSEAGEGTTVTMTLPVSVAIDDILFIECGGEEFGVPTKAVQDIESAATLEIVDGRRVLTDGDDTYSVIELDDVLETPRASANGDGMVVRIRDDVRSVALHCDHVYGQQEVVVKPFEGFMSDIPGLSGATVRGRGEVVNILDVTTL